MNARQALPRRFRYRLLILTMLLALPVASPVGVHSAWKAAGLATDVAHAAQLTSDQAVARAVGDLPGTADFEVGTNDFRISDMGPNGDTNYAASDAAVAYNSANNEYLVVWQGSDNSGNLVAGELEIFGQRINAATGAQVGANDFRISDMGPDGNTNYAGAQPQVAYNSRNNEYLVVWVGDDNTGALADDEFEIFGQRIDAATGAQVGTNDFRISNIGPDGNNKYRAGLGRVAYNSVDNQYLVVWYTSNSTGIVGEAQHEVYGQRLSASGAEIGPNDFRISNIGQAAGARSGAFYPAVAYNSMRNEYLVVWQGDNAAALAEDEIYGQRLSALGTQVGASSFRISDMGPNGNTNYRAQHPAVAYNRTSNQYLVVWWGDDNTGALADEEFEIYGQRLSAVGAEVGTNDFRISDMGPDGDLNYSTGNRWGVGYVAYNKANNQYFTVWYGDDNRFPLVDNEYEIFGQRLALPPTWLVLLYLAGDDIPADAIGQESLTDATKRLLWQLRTMPPNWAMQLVVLFDGNQPNDSALYVRDPGAVGLTRITTPAPWPSGFTAELDTGSLTTLHDFVGWAQIQYPDAAHTMLSIVDHGGGWAPDDGASGQPRGVAMKRAGGLTGMSFDASGAGGFGSSLSTKETSAALKDLKKLDVLFFDACLMGMLESAYEVQPYADYFVAGQNLLWSQLPYQNYLDPSVLTKDTSPQALAQLIAKEYNEPAPGNEPFTIAAIDMSKLPDVTTATRTLAKTLLDSLPTGATPVAGAEDKIRAAYRATQKFDYDNNFTIDLLSEGVVDLADFAEHLIAQHITQAIDTAAGQVRNAVLGTGTPTGAVIARKVAPGTSRYSAQEWVFGGAYGLSIYLPLGVRDCRAIGPIRQAGQPGAPLAPCTGPDAPVGTPLVEPRLPDYSDGNQLAFARDVPEWAGLLQKLDATTPNRDPNSAPIESPGLGHSSSRIYFPLLQQ